MSKQLSSDDELHLSLLNYLLGHSVHQLPSQAQLQYEIADIDELVPPAISTLFNQIDAIVQELRKWSTCARKQRLKLAAGALTTASGILRQEFGKAWQSSNHKTFISFRQWAAEELDTNDYMWNAPNRWVEVEADRWRDVINTSRDLWVELPDQLGKWAELGSVIALLCNRELNGDRVEARSRLPILHSNLRQCRRSLMKGIHIDIGMDKYLEEAVVQSEAMSFEVWETRQAKAYHDTIIARLSGLNVSGEAGKSDLPRVPEEQADEIPREMLAEAILKQHPEITMAEIARRVGCARTSLYRMTTFMQAWRANGGYKLPRGYRVRGRDGSMGLEAEDSHDHDDNGDE